MLDGKDVLHGVDKREGWLQIHIPATSSEEELMKRLQDLQQAEALTVMRHMLDLRKRTGSFINHSREEQGPTYPRIVLDC